MSTNERNSQAENGLHQNGEKNPNMKRSPQKEWDESYGQRFSNPYHLQQKEGKEAHKQQQENAQDPEVSESDSNQSENQRNQDPTRRSDNQEVEE